ncbi:NACHT domain protein [Micromonospora sp. MW-13]|uniref:NACHT domain-containing protein n=1 Tax=Micromonospora sp. MW-13 TaxID=2094022 RepID=UPI000E43EA7E|nr:NACHT domain-containing protein [Micromonospora sp. MW-13]RGC70897.1 NACHT domain protein [Micromonospora sp. MW-13]
MPELPELPFGLQYAAVGLFLLTVVAGVAQQFFSDWAQRALARAWRRISGRRRGVREDDWRRYRAWALRTYSSVELGFLQNVSVDLGEVYVPLQYEQDGRRIDVQRDLRTGLRTVVLGAAGAGKSMLLRHSMLRWAAGPEESDRVPVLVELTRYNRQDRSIQQLVVDALNRPDDEHPGRGRQRRKPTPPLVADAEQVTPLALAHGQLCVFLDGLDEVVTDRRADVVQDIKEFAERYPTCQIVVTCRDAVYDGDLRPTFDREIRVAGFDDAGIRHFLRLWFTRHRRLSGDEEPTDPRQAVEQLLADLRGSPTVMRLARSPLMLTMIATLYEADPGAGPMMPNSRAEFYEQAVDHLLRRDRDLGRHGSLARYKAGHKLMALRAVALAAQGATSGQADQRVISEEEIYAALSRVLPRFRLDGDNLPHLIDEIIERSGLLLRTDDNNLLYEFAHLTLQEYLAAVELADDPERLFTLYSENPKRWRETVKLWCAGANRDASGLVRRILGGNERDQLLALECVAEARQIDERLAGDIVDRFLLHLGESGTDKHLVLAALGAVAGNAGPLGQRLIDQLRVAAAAGGPIGEDAAVALAESRRREAIEALSELAEDSPTARAALRSTGELAIPVLLDRAQAGSLVAVDDLAAIGTPAAAVAVAEQLWGAGPVAVRAAWRLAALIGAPDVENELCHFNPGPFARDGDPEWYDWLWVPFTASATDPMARTMGRVGWLIDRSTGEDVPPDLEGVDVRLALGIGAKPSPFKTGKVPAEVSEALVAAARRLGHRRRVAAADLTTVDVEQLLDLIHRSEPELARRLALTVLDLRASDSRNALLRQLPGPVLVGLAARLWLSTSLDAETRDWRTLHERPEAPTVLAVCRSIAVTIGVLLGVALVGIGVVRSVATLTGSWVWGPRWLAVVVVLSLALSLVGFVAMFVSGKAGEPPLPAIFAVLLGAAVLLAASAFIGVPTLAGWIGVFSTAFSLSAVAIAIVVLTIWTSRRKRALRNPYRALLQRHNTDAEGLLDSPAG